MEQKRLPSLTILARIDALRFDYTLLVNAAARYERCEQETGFSMRRSAAEARKGAEILRATIEKLMREHGICPKCGEQCGYWNLPLCCGK